MRIAYLTTYQGASLLERRPILKNRSLSNTIKIELIACALAEAGHDVEIISQGEVVENRFSLYTGFSAPQRFHADIPIGYASALPIRRLNGLWSSWQTLRLFKSRHHTRPFDVAIIFNMKEPQIACASYAMRRMGIPVILDYEDDAFVNVMGETATGLVSNYWDRKRKDVLQKVSACFAVSPWLLSQVPDGIPKMLLRGAVNRDIVSASKRNERAKRNWILFSGTHIESNGVGPLIEAWQSAPVPGWELHITGYGQLTDSLREKAKNVPDVMFHGLVTRQELVELMSQAHICINPHMPSLTPGNVFAFKIIEYLAAGAHCITTRMGTLEQDIEMGISYMPNNAPATIAATLKIVIENRHYERHATEATHEAYGARAISTSLSELLREVANRNGKHSWYELEQAIPAVEKISGAGERRF
jgi:hypothetical protein